MRDSDTQVAIVGAGPAGLALALLLRERGVDCVVVDKYSRQQLLERARAGFLESRTVQLLDRLGLGKRVRAEGIAHTACEFRHEGDRLVLDYETWCRGAPSYVYPQHAVVSDLLDAYESGGGTTLLGTPVTEVDGNDLPLVTCADGTTIRAEVVAGAAGQYGPVRASLPQHAVTEHTVRHDARLLAVLVNAPPSAPHTVYGVHPHGFAGHMLRSREATRMYVEMAAGETASDWPSERIWEELDIRLAAPGWSLQRGDILETAVVEMHARATEPLHHGRTVLLGDEAHIVPPAGGKGMNLAMADAAALAAALGEHFTDPETRPIEGVLADYSRKQLADMWRALEFTDYMIQLLHADHFGQSQYYDKLRKAQLHRLRDEPHYARSFIERYAGCSTE